MPRKKQDITREDVLFALEMKTMPKLRRYISQSGLEVIDVINAHALSFSEGNILKYVIRSGAAKDYDGLSKGLWYTVQELQYHAKAPLEPLSRTHGRAPSVGRITKVFGLNRTQEKIVRELLKRAPDASSRIRGLLKIARWIQELLDHARPDVKAEVASRAKARPRPKKLGKKRS